MKKLFFLLTAFALCAVTASAQLPTVNKDKMPSMDKKAAPTADIGDLLGQFATEGLDKDAVSKDFDAEGFAKGVSGLSDIGEIGGHINNLVSVVKPEMWKDGVDVEKLKSAGTSAVKIADATGLMNKIQDSLLPKAFGKNWDPAMFSTALSMLK